MSRKTINALFLALALTTGCSQTMNQFDAGSVQAKPNPHPQKRYELTFTIHGAPGPFDSVTSDILYEVGNEECVPSDSISGAKSKTPGIDIAIQLKRMSTVSYTGQIALDLPVNEDYFGLGVCRWRSNGAYLNMDINGVKFSADILQNDIESEDAASTYFLKDHYSGVPVSGFVDGGATQANYAKMADKSKYFSVTIRARRLVP